MKSEPALFCYRLADSPVHRAPAWLKIIFLITVTLRTFSKTTYALPEDFFIPLELIQWIRIGFYFVLSMALFFAAGTPLSSLKKLKFILVLAVCLLLISLCTPCIEQEDGATFISLNIAGLKSDMLYISRFFVTVLASLVVFETTSRMELFDFFVQAENVVCRVIPPFKKLNAALILSVTITFIPEVFACWSRISLAAAARTPAFRKDRRNFWKRFCSAQKRLKLHVSALNACITAFFLNMLQYAEEVRQAVNSRIES